MDDAASGEVNVKPPPPTGSGGGSSGPGPAASRANSAAWAAMYIAEDAGLDRAAEGASRGTARLTGRGPAPPLADDDRTLTVCS